MPLKIIVIVFIGFLSIFSIESHAVKDRKDETVGPRQLLNDSLARYREIFDATNGYLVDVENYKKTCIQSVAEITNTCSNSCSAEATNKLKSKYTECMKGFINFTYSKSEYNPLQIRINAEILKLRLQSVWFNDMALFKTTLLAKLNIILESLKAIRKNCEDMSNAYGNKLTSLLRQDFIKARAEGILAGTIKGTCLHLKGALEGQQIAFSIKNIVTSYLYWNKFLDKVKGYKIVSDAIRNDCPADMMPADYGPFEAEVEAYTKTLFNSEWIKSECEKPKVKAYLGSRCEGTIVVDSYIRAALEQVEK